MPQIPSSKPRREQLSINLFDLDRMLQEVRQMLLGGKLDLKTAIRIDKDRPDETAVAFVCDLLTAACICDTIRSHDRGVGDFPTRVYIKRVEAWERITNNIVLTVLMNGRVRLCPSMFPAELKPVSQVPLDTKPLFQEPNHANTDKQTEASQFQTEKVWTTVEGT